MGISRMIDAPPLVVSRFELPRASMMFPAITVSGVDNDIHYIYGNLFCTADGCQDTDTVCPAGLDPGLLLRGRPSHGHGGRQVAAVV